MCRARSCRPDPAPWFFFVARAGLTPAATLFCVLSVCLAASRPVSHSVGADPTPIPPALSSPVYLTTPGWWARGWGGVRGQTQRQEESIGDSGKGTTAGACGYGGTRNRGRTGSRASQRQEVVLCTIRHYKERKYLTKIYPQISPLAVKETGGVVTSLG